ncbi:hypothetical protein BDA99DRAFT_574929 [Phascolomyces articulosus]|uniref:Uncharacterized protein n=1 Tax=Phascolomyces articulosus TaxID=60185 RepID=A0AAD5K3G9_9FUNG|nr:hypothetical protein BDA99DRAFT_574929 [Phascolomyces articulosus]
MPRFRSLSTNTPPPRTSPAPSGTSSPTLLARGFRSLRRARRQSTSVPSSPVPASSQSTPRADQNQQRQNHLHTVPLQQYNSAPLSTSTSTSSSIASSEVSPVVLQDQRQHISGQNNNEEEDPTHGPHIRLVPNVGIGNRCFVFDIIDRSLDPGAMLKIGRYSDRNVAPDRLSFKSKVVSRSHAELWVPPDCNKLYIRDVGSSSGTFVNRARLSPAGVRSSAQEIKDGDLIQLGVDYQGGIEPMYRAVRMRLEVNREQTVSHPFSRAAFQQLRSHLLAAVAPGSAGNRQGEEEEVVVDLNPHDPHHHHAPTHQPYPNLIRAQHSILLDDHSDEENDETDIHKAAIKRLAATNSASPHTATVRGSPVVNQSDIQECCICLYAIAPFQALFIAPCSHIFHFKCLRPILFQNYPGFSCPICRTYSDLEASVAVEVSEVLESLGLSSSAPPKVGEGRHDHDCDGEESGNDEDGEYHHPLRQYATMHGDGRHTEILEEEEGEQQEDHHTESQEQEPENRSRRQQQPSSSTSTTSSGLSVPTRALSQRAHGDGGLLSTTLVATPPTYEEMLTDSSISSSVHRS